VVGHDLLAERVEPVDLAALPRQDHRLPRRVAGGVLLGVPPDLDEGEGELELRVGGDQPVMLPVGGHRRPVADLPPDAQAAVRDASGAVLVSGFHRIGNPGNGANQVDLFLWQGAPRGTWAVVLHGEQVNVGSADAYIERTDPRHQSRFLPDAATSRGTTNSVCNGWLPLSVGAYDARSPSRPPGSFSSAGPTRDGRTKPDVAAPGLGIQAARSAVGRADDTWSRDGLTCKSGTSMAAPHVTGLVALLFQSVAPRLLPMALTRWIVMKSARRDPPSTAADELRYGAGRVDARGACTLARALTTQPARVALSREMARTPVEPTDLRKEAMTVSSETSPATPWPELPPTPWPLPTESSSVEDAIGQLRLAGTVLVVEPRPPTDPAPDLDAAVRSALRRSTEHTLVQAPTGADLHSVTLQAGRRGMNLPAPPDRPATAGSSGAAADRPAGPGESALGYQRLKGELQRLGIRVSATADTGPGIRRGLPKQHRSPAIGRLGRGA